MTRPTRWIVSAIFFPLVAGVLLAGVAQLAILSGPTATATAGVPYSSALVATGGIPANYFYSITANPDLLPPGLTLNANTGAITGTPTTVGTYTFLGNVTDTLTDPVTPTPGPDSQAAARRRGLAQSGNHAASASNSFTITVGSGASSAAVGTPTSPWTLALVMAGLAGAGFWRLRQTRRA
jgi:hypothetical protein